MTLETRDFVGVEIMAVGGPYRGQGSPPEGDTFTAERLEAIASSNRELAGEVRVPIKLGHDPRQPLLTASGLVDDRGAPAAGWVENIRLAGGKMLGDFRRVPAKLASLVESGAFRTRSVELSRYTSPTTKQTHDVISGLALLGSVAPAVRNLDDIVALYENGPLESGVSEELEEGVRVLEYEVAADAAAIAPIQGDRMTDVTFTPEQVVALATALGVPEKDAATLEPAKLLEAATAKATADAEALKAEAAKVADADRKLEAANAELDTLKAAAGGESSDDLAKTLRELSAQAAAGVAAHEELRELRRDTLIGEAVKDGRIPPAQIDTFKRQYDAAPEAVSAILAGLPKVVDTRTFGAAGGEAELTTEAQAEEDALLRAFGAELGITLETEKAA